MARITHPNPSHVPAFKPAVVELQADQQVYRIEYDYSPANVKNAVGAFSRVYRRHLDPEDGARFDSTDGFPVGFLGMHWEAEPAPYLYFASSPAGAIFETIVRGDSVSVGTYRQVYTTSLANRRLAGFSWRTALEAVDLEHHDTLKSLHVPRTLATCDEDEYTLTRHWAAAIRTYLRRLGLDVGVLHWLSRMGMRASDDVFPRDEVYIGFMGEGSVREPDDAGLAVTLDDGFGFLCVEYCCDAIDVTLVDG